MTLREMFQEEPVYINPYSFKLTKESAEKFEKLTDEFAIDFAEWILIKYNEDIIFDEYTSKELLEIYKKEKGL